jgi:hypothetical protein
MNVKELIEKLEQCDPDLPVCLYVDDDVFNVVHIDNTMRDRIDINGEDV